MAVNTVLIDTNAYSLYVRGDVKALKIIQHTPQLLISTVVLGELRGGFELGNRTRQNNKQLNSFLQSKRVTIVDVTEETTLFYATVYKELRVKGRPIPTNDMWIAATALQYQCPVWTYDKHFTQISGLQVVKTLQDLQG